MEDLIEVTEVKNTPALFIQQAIQQGLGIEHLEKLMDLQERWDANQAKKSFLIALSNFQSTCPQLEKKKQVAFGNTKYKYAPLGEIDETIKPFLKEAGLSKRWEIQDSTDDINCTFIVSHIDGHSEKTSMSAKKDNSGGKNEIQSRGSTITYLQRYTLIAGLGITTADEDVDGRSDLKPKADANEQKPASKPQEVKKDRDYTAEADACLKEADYKTAFKNWWNGLTAVERKNLAGLKKHTLEEIEKLDAEPKNGVDPKILQSSNFYLVQLQGFKTKEQLATFVKIYQENINGLFGMEYTTVINAIEAKEQELKKAA